MERLKEKSPKPKFAMPHSKSSRFFRALLAVSASAIMLHSAGCSSNNPGTDSRKGKGETRLDTDDSKKKQDFSGVFKALEKPGKADSSGVAKRELWFESVPILMFHNFSSTKDSTRYNTSPTEFRSILQKLYNKGHFLVSAREFLENDYSRLPEGKKPVLLTFDDSYPAQLKFNSDNSISPNCAVGVILDFCKEHPDFGMGGIFFVIASPFGQPQYEKKKLNLLLDLGFEIGSHSYSHKKFNHLSHEEAEFQISALDSCLKEALGDRFSEVRYFAYPYGLRGNEDVINSRFKAVFNAIGPLSKTADKPEFDRFAIPRTETNGKLPRF